MINWGFLAAILTALAWGTYLVPYKKLGSGNFVVFQSVMSWGILISGLAICLIIGFPINLNIYGLLAGVLWAVGNGLSLVAVANLGLSRATPVMSSLVILSTFLWGALIFKELPGGIFMALMGILLIISGVIIATSITNVSSQNRKKGWATGVLAGLVWGSQLAPLKLGNVGAANFFFSSCLGIFLMAQLFLIIKRPYLGKEFRKALVGGLLSGAIWNIGNLLSILAIALIGMAKSLPITQTAVLIAIFWGMFYFKEIQKRRYKIQVLGGALVILAGVVILGMS